MNKPRRPPKRGSPVGSIVFALLETAEVVETKLEEAVSSAGLSLAKLGVLRLLADANRPLPLSELAAIQHCVRSNITQLVDRLQEEGLVRRRPDPDDRRGVLAELTPMGRNAHARGMRALTEAQRALVSGLKANDIANLKSALEALES